MNQIKMFWVNLTTEVIQIGQSECLRAIEKAKDWVTSKDIAKLLKQHRAIVCVSLLKLYSYSEIKRRKSKITKLGYEYKKL